MQQARTPRVEQAVKQERDLEGGTRRSRWHCFAEGRRQELDSSESRDSCAGSESCGVKTPDGSGHAARPPRPGPSVPADGSRAGIEKKACGLLRNSSIQVVLRGRGERRMDARSVGKSVEWRGTLARKPHERKPREEPRSESADSRPRLGQGWHGRVAPSGRRKADARGEVDCTRDGVERRSPDGEQSPVGKRSSRAPWSGTEVVGNHCLGRSAEPREDREVLYDRVSEGKAKLRGCSE